MGTAEAGAGRAPPFVTSFAGTKTGNTSMVTVGSGDYTPVSGSLRFAPGQTVKTVSVPIAVPP